MVNLIKRIVVEKHDVMFQKKENDLTAINWESDCDFLKRQEKENMT
jgi:hypothetical protein